MTRTTKLRMQVVNQLLDGIPPCHVRDNLNVSDMFLTSTICQFLKYHTYPGRYERQS